MTAVAGGMESGEKMAELSGCAWVCSCIIVAWRRLAPITGEDVMRCSGGSKTNEKGSVVGVVAAEA